MKLKREKFEFSDRVTWLSHDTCFYAFYVTRNEGSVEATAHNSLGPARFSPDNGFTFALDGLTVSYDEWSEKTGVVLSDALIRYMSEVEMLMKMQGQPR